MERLYNAFIILKKYYICSYLLFRTYIFEFERENNLNF